MLACETNRERHVHDNAHWRGRPPGGGPPYPSRAFDPDGFDELRFFAEGPGIVSKKTLRDGCGFAISGVTAAEFVFPPTATLLLR